MASTKVSTSCVHPLHDSTQASASSWGAPASPPTPAPPALLCLLCLEGWPLLGTDGEGADIHRPVSPPPFLRPHLAVRGTPVLSPRVAEVSGAGPGSPDLPPPRGAGLRGRGGRYFLFRSVSPAGGVGGHGKVRPQVCGGGRRHARRGAAIFGDFGAAEPRPPPGKPRPGQPRPRPPPALSHRPGGGGSNGRGALGALLALFSQGGSRLAGGTKGRWRAAGAGAEGVAAVPHPHPRSPRPCSSAAGPAATVGVGLCVPPPPPVRWPQGVGGMRGQMPGWGGGEWPPFWEAAPEARDTWTRWGPAPGRTGPAGPAQGEGEHRLLRCDFSVLQLGSTWPCPRSPRGCALGSSGPPPPRRRPWGGDREDAAAPGSGEQGSSGEEGESLHLPSCPEAGASFPS